MKYNRNAWVSSSRHRLTLRDRMRLAIVGGLLVIVLQLSPFSLWAQESGSASRPPFSDVSRAAGILNNRQGEEKAIGQAWADYDRDGWLDLYVTDSDGPNTLYRNNGDGTFAVSPLSAQVALADQLSGGAIFADYDNDGWPDLYVLNWGQNILFHNEQGEAFVDVTGSAGLFGPAANSKTASWGDFDGDGFLDLYVANWACYPRCGRPATGEKDRLFHNQGDGSFRDVTGLLGVGTTTGAGFVASFTDYDNDGDPDIYLVNDEFINPIGNVLWRNDGPGCDGWCFSEVSEEAGANTRLMGMGLATADYDNDGDLDYYFSNAGPMALLQNQGDGTFVDAAEQAGVLQSQSIGWGAVFFDYDNDGWGDLYLAVMDAVAEGSAANPLWHNEGDGTFSDMGEGSGVADSGATLGVAYADYDNDGWVDLVIGNYDEGYRLYRNELGAASDNRRLTLDLQGGGGVNRDAVGARVYVTVGEGMTQMQEVICGSSLGAGNEMALHFGLGKARSADVKVVWPDGLTQSFKSVPSDQRVTLAYPVGPLDRVEQLTSLYRPWVPAAILIAALMVLLLVAFVFTRLRVT